MEKLIAVIRLRGLVDKTEKQRATFTRLRLLRKNVCSLVPKTPEFMGMLHKVKDFIAFGEIDEKTLKDLLEKRGRLQGNKKVTNVDEPFIKNLLEGKAKLQDKGIKLFFRLNPPRGGFERKGIKKAFKEGGALGYRGEAINKLIMKML